jgi:hypothetical protein
MSESSVSSLSWKVQRKPRFKYLQPAARFGPDPPRRVLASGRPPAAARHLTEPDKPGRP